MTRVQKEGELGEDYANDVNLMCSRLGKQPGEKMSQIIRGLKPSLRKFCLGKRPTSFDDLLSWIRLGDTLDLDSVENVSSVLLEETRNLRKEIQSLSTSQAPPAQPPQPKPWGRPNRTVDGQVICRVCSRVGHHQQVCPERRPPPPRCYYCNYVGHIEAECRNKQRDLARQRNVERRQYFDRQPPEVRYNPQNRSFRGRGRPQPRVENRNNYRENSGNRYRATSGGR